MLNRSEDGRLYPGAHEAAAKESHASAPSLHRALIEQMGVEDAYYRKAPAPAPAPARRRSLLRLAKMLLPVD
jgi:hypothetical protein